MTLGHAIVPPAWAILAVARGDPVAREHTPAGGSFGDVRRRIHGGRLDASALAAIVRDGAAVERSDRVSNRSADLSPRADPTMPLRRPAFAALLLAAFVVALGAGVMLPILPGIVEQLVGNFNQLAVARHTAWLTAVFVAAPLAAALPWGRLSDRLGRRPVVIVGLMGFAVTLAGSVFASSLPILYAARFLNGAFAAAVIPSALAFVADTVANEARRARSFGGMSVAASLGLLAGPVIGGLAPEWAVPALGTAVRSNGTVALLIVTVAAVVAALSVARLVPVGPLADRRHIDKAVGTKPGSAEIRLLILTALAAGGLGAFEVGLTLRSRDLAMTPSTLGLMFASCMVVMLVVQGIAFSPLIKPTTTRLFIAPAFALLALGLGLIPVAGGLAGLMAATGLVAASGGLLAPLLIYWLSRVSQRGQGAELGLQSAVAGLGQALGAAALGLAFAGCPGAMLWLAGAVMAAAAVGSVTLPQRLAGNATAKTPAKKA